MLIKDNKLLVEFVRSENNPSNIMTKNCPEKLFWKHAEAILTGTVDVWREDVNDDVEVGTDGESSDSPSPDS